MHQRRQVVPTKASRVSDRTTSAVLVVDDDAGVRKSVRTALTRSGYRCLVAENLLQAGDLLYSHPIELMVLDRVLPEGDGLQLLKNPDNRFVRVLVLSSRGEVRDRVVGLEAGADDYLPKPFSDQELVLRVSALLQRSRQPSGSPLAVGSYAFDPDRRVIARHSVDSSGASAEVVRFTAKESRFFHSLLLSEGRIVPREELIDRLWTSERYPTQGAMDVLVSRVKKKLTVLSAEILLESRYGVGYRLVVIPREG